MNISVLTQSEPQILKISIRVKDPKPQTIRLVVCDRNQNNTVLTNRYKAFTGDEFFYVRMPLSPNVALVQVYNEAVGNRSEKQETTFELIGEGVERLRLERKMDLVDMANPDVKAFVKHAQKFCYHAGVLDPGEYDHGPIKIKYLPIITQNNGKESATPARIQSGSRIIEVSQRIFTSFTVPMRFAILCHEFAHCFMNSDAYNESEADLQGLLIYLGLGYPRIEAYQAFLETFIGTPSPLNQKRYNTIKRFITDFEQHKFIFNE